MITSICIYTYIYTYIYIVYVTVCHKIGYIFVVASAYITMYTDGLMQTRCNFIASAMELSLLHKAVDVKYMFHNHMYQANTPYIIQALFVKFTAVGSLYNRFQPNAMLPTAV